MIPSPGPLTWVERMRLQAVHHVVVSFQQHQVLSSVPVPDEDVATVGTTHHKVSTPEIGFFYLRGYKEESIRKFKSKLFK